MTSKSSKRTRYFVNAPIDFFFIGGASFIMFGFLLLFYTDARTPEVITAAVMLSWAINWPHFSMSTYRLYQSRSNIKQYPITAYVIPFVVLGGVALSFSFPDIVAPYYVKLFMLWSPYHFSGQTLGITFIYAMRSGIKLSNMERKVITSFVLGTYFLSTIRAETSREGYTFYGVQYPSMQIPQWIAKIAEYAMWAAFIAFIAMIVYWSYRNRRILPLMVILPAATQYLWFVQSVYMPSFQEFVPMLHSLQYILIAWGIQLKEKMDVKHIEPSKRYVATETTRWFVINFIGGAILFYFLPDIGVALGYTSLFSIAIVYAAIQIHHFFVDGVIWKLKNKTVSHPLMMTFEELTEPRREPRQAQPATT
ncbi:hypothetical protein [Kaarinaea lacus]